MTLPAISQYLTGAGTLPSHRVLRSPPFATTACSSLSSQSDLWKRSVWSCDFSREDSPMPCQPSKNKIQNLTSGLWRSPWSGPKRPLGYIPNFVNLDYKLTRDSTPGYLTDQHHSSLLLLPFRSPCTENWELQGKLNKGTVQSDGWGYREAPGELSAGGLLSPLGGSSSRMLEEGVRWSVLEHHPWTRNHPTRTWTPSPSSTQISWGSPLAESSQQPESTLVLTNVGSANESPVRESGAKWQVEKQMERICHDYPKQLWISLKRSWHTNILPSGSPFSFLPSPQRSLQPWCPFTGIGVPAMCQWHSEPSLSTAQ